jgi:1-aminocyclopropane-1-carboxylate deaminase
MVFENNNSIVEKIEIPELGKRDIVLYVKRDDLIHEHVSGNKWRKLKYNIELCSSRKKNGLLTFGGAFSNHLIATAAVCNEVGLKSIGIVRGDELSSQSNNTLRNCHQLGMQLLFVSRDEYAFRSDKGYLETLKATYPNFHIVPEGGANYHGMIGCQEIMHEIDVPIDDVFVAQGTATTSCGILMGLKENQFLHVVPVLKGYDSIAEMKNIFELGAIDSSWLENMLERVAVLSDYHFGGYGKYTEELLIFIKDFYKEHKLRLDPIYTGKTMFATLKELQSDSYNGKNVLFVHTGGVQGADHIIKRSGIDLYA